MKFNFGNLIRIAAAVAAVVPEIKATVRVVKETVKIVKNGGK